MARDLPAIKIVRTTPPNLVGKVAAAESLTVKPVAPSVWDEFLQLQISPATRRSYAAALKDFFGRELEVEVSVAAIESFLQLPEREAIGHVLNYRGQLLTGGLAAATVNARLAALRSFVIHAYKRKLCNFRLDDIKSVKAQSYKDTRGISTAEDGAQASSYSSS